MVTLRRLGLLASGVAIYLRYTLRCLQIFFYHMFNPSNLSAKAVKCAVAYCGPLSGRPNIPHTSSMTPVMATAVTAPDSSLTITLQEVLNEGRKHEAAALGTMQLQGLSEQKIDYVKTKKRCWNCGLIHKYRQCPAFEDTEGLSGVVASGLGKVRYLN